VETEDREPEDRELVRQVLAGETDLFRLVVDRHQQSIFRFAFGLLGKREEAQDLSQETFLAVYINLAAFDSSRAALSTWLFTIARNRCINLLAETEELPYAKIARIENTSLGTVKSRVHRAKQKLQSLLDPEIRETR